MFEGVLVQLFEYHVLLEEEYSDELFQFELTYHNGIGGFTNLLPKFDSKDTASPNHNLTNIQNINLPKITLPTDGNQREWFSFCAQFIHSIINNSCFSESNKLIYLKLSLKETVFDDI